MSKPAQFGDEYINREGFASINLQATCNAQEIFTSIYGPVLHMTVESGKGLIFVP
nr:unnamed protein product [Callosobruchus analis]